MPSPGRIRRFGRNWRSAASGSGAGERLGRQIRARSRSRPPGATGSWPGRRAPSGAAAGPRPGRSSGRAARRPRRTRAGRPGPPSSKRMKAPIGVSRSALRVAVSRIVSAEPDNRRTSRRLSGSVSAIGIACCLSSRPSPVAAERPAPSSPLPASRGPGVGPQGPGGRPRRLAGNQNDLPSRDERSILPRCHPHSAMPLSWPTGRALAVAARCGLSAPCRRRRLLPIGAALYRWRSAPEPTGEPWKLAVWSGGSRVHSLSSPPQLPPTAGSLRRRREVLVPITARIRDVARSLRAMGASMSNEGRGGRRRAGGARARSGRRASGRGARARGARLRRGANFPDSHKHDMRQGSGARIAPRGPTDRRGELFTLGVASPGACPSQFSRYSAAHSAPAFAACRSHGNPATSRPWRGRPARGRPARRSPYQYSSVWSVPMSWPLSRTKPRAAAQAMTVSIMPGLPHRKMSKLSGVSGRPVSSSIASEAMTFWR